MRDAPDRIWYSPEWNICHRKKQSYNTNADITFGIEYIHKDIVETQKQEAYDKGYTKAEEIWSKLPALGEK